MSASGINYSPFPEDPNKIPTDATLADLEAMVSGPVNSQIPEFSATEKQQLEGRQWPEQMSEAAFQGQAGEFVRLVLPQTEADPHALLLTFLVCFGSITGRGPYYQVEATRHHVNLHMVLVGDTAKARKGTATDRALQVLRAVDADFVRDRKRSGLSSGEGLIQAVRDPREEDVSVKERSGTFRLERQVVDSGEPDKRLLVVESEFASPLQASGREGNILSAILRDAWDGNPLRVLARSNKDSCEQPHISLIGNITMEELHRLLTDTDKANGFGNRILWCCARRSKLLPHGGTPPEPSEWEHLISRLKSALAAAREPGRVIFSNEAARAWEGAYPLLTQGATGLFGSMTARAEAQCVRLAMLYAILDSSRVIRLEHLEAALEVWIYCEDSVRCIFGDALGDATADAIVRMLKGEPDGMTQTELSHAFGRHKPAAELQRALSVLLERNLISCTRRGTAGAPVTIYSILAKEAK
jgi:hypothetical protein